MKEVVKQYKDAIDYLNENYAYFLTHILNIGKPSWSEQIETACVALDKDFESKEEFRFIFNPEFAKNLGTEDFSFVLAHETMHILLDHITLSMKFDYPQIFNLAADAVINDYLANGGFDVPEMAVTGEKLVGFDCSNSSVTEVYNLIEDQAKQMQQAIEEFCEQMEGESQRFDDHEWIHNPEMFAGSKMRNIVGDNIPEDIRETRDESFNDGDTCQSLGKGDEQGAMKNFMAGNNVSLKWAELLKKLNPDLFPASGLCPAPESSFRQPSRKLTSMYPKVILPIYEDPSDTKELRRGKDKVSIVIALDTSGSIGDETARRFIQLAQSIPQDKIHLNACTFTTCYSLLDLDNPQFHSGGTDFSAIEEYIQKEVMTQNGGVYPSAVVAITDGEASWSTVKPNAEDRKNWHWLLQDRRDANNSYFTQYVKHMFEDDQIDFLEEYIGDGK